MLQKLKINIISLSILSIIGLVIICFTYLYYNYQFWSYLDTEHMVELTEYNGENIVGLKGRQILVNESFLPQMKQLGKFASQNNLVLFVIHSYRPNGSLIINAIVNPVSLSNHQVGYAIDINIKYKRKVYTSSDLRLDNMNNLPSSICRFLVQVRECKIMRWGGDFNIPDPVHVDYPLNINNYNHFLTCKTMCTKDYTEAKRRWKF